MVLARRLRLIKWGFVAMVLTAPLTRSLAVAFESQPSTCPSQILFGMACPACGGTRAGLYLVSGDVVSAVQTNVGLVAFVAAFGALFAAGRLPIEGFLGVANPSEPVAEWRG